MIRKAVVFENDFVGAEPERAKRRMAAWSREWL